MRHRYLKELSAASGFGYVDLSSLLTDRRDLTCEIAPQYNIKGHEVIGKRLTEEILARLGHLI